ncbi:Putative lipoprotein/NMB1162 [Achromobacter insolitus]|uniref:Lipoprotein/NMB1162 n=2 Tax=Alcaligenaceae TaxID=506 RepID=A0A6S7FFM3_9BURK|nr:hypothetical protein A7J71_12695 [Achromobacter insolitus]OCZ56152.1 hypothetical protein A7P22_28315 [Achromobacter insolitus]CAB3932146.1 Putative lipoprotein/NMB1162 [Achromobacter insolitus]CAB3938617.1 Putative lipoprotein/NMB1162 [Achromobacter insolitus]CAB3941356.1 Putative lipoprotein/NMB1162 [Achromobacter insolitus]
MSSLFRMGMLAAVALLAGCAVPQQNVDYTAFRESKPASILVLPPVNTSVDVAATAAVLSQATLPLAESGYYVVPVAVMDETFKQNGLSSADEIQELPAAKLRDIFGADAALYMTVKQYGSTYAVVSSSVTVAVDAELIDLRNGAKLWSGSKQVVQASSSSGGGLLGMLIQAVVDQVVNTLSDRSYGVAGMTNNLLLSAGQPGGMLYGPRSPRYDTQ